MANFLDTMKSSGGVYNLGSEILKKNCPQIDISENNGTPKWMVKIMENPIKMDDLGGKPTIFGNTQMAF